MKNIVLVVSIFGATVACTEIVVDPLGREDLQADAGAELELDASSPPPPSSRFESVVAGTDHTCTLLPDRTVKCWGDNVWGQLGDGTTLQRLTPVLVADLKGAQAIEAGDRHSCALLSDGTVACWGSNENGQLGDGTTDTRLRPVQVAGLSNVAQISAARDHTCARTNDGHVKCWGNNASGQLGDGTNERRLIPVDVATLSDIKDVAAGWNYTCAVGSLGVVNCWGEREVATDAGPATNDFLPVQRADFSNATQVAAGISFLCVRSGDRVRCANRGGFAEGVPAEIGQVEQVYSKGDHACALLSSHAVTCWGANYVGQLGDGTTLDHHSEPSEVPGLSAVKALGVGAVHSCAVLETGRRVCWGFPGSGLGNGMALRFEDPVPARDLSGVSELSVGQLHSCARTSDGIVKCWGANASFETGTWERNSIPLPRPVPEITTAVSLSVATYGEFDLGRTCAALADGTAYCWGNHTYIRQLRSISDAVAVATGLYHVCVLRSSHRVTCRELGTMEDENWDQPWWGDAAAQEWEDVKGIASNRNGTCALLGNGRVRCSGVYYGKEGAFAISDPTADMPGVEGATQIAMGRDHACALSAGMVKCWGDNHEGQVGASAGATGTVDVPGVSDAVHISAGGSGTCATRTDGRVFCWGQPFDPMWDPSTNLPPTEFPRLRGLRSIGIGDLHACGLRDTGAVECWGWNFDGQIGVGVPTSSPTNAIGIP